MSTKLERAKYEGIYSSGKLPRYGHSNHGARALPIVQTWQPESLIDVGCGYNEFVIAARAALPGLAATGVDFACPGADLIADAAALPFKRKTFDALTAFDVLEHVAPEDVDTVLAEFARVSHRFIFSISYVPSVNKWQGQTLHPTVREEAWWLERIRAAGGAPAKHGHYITGHWAVRPVEPRESVILVGNGPSVLQSGKGSLVDTFDQVVRFNLFAIRGFEADVGTRTDLWSTFGRGSLPRDADQRPQRAIFLHGEKPKGFAFPVREIYGIPRPFFDSVRARVQARTQRTGEAKDKLLATSGLTVALWLLEAQGLQKLTLHGFDHFSKVKTGLHHYWVPTNFKQPPEHDGEVEAAIFAELQAAGRVAYL